MHFCALRGSDAPSALCVESDGAHQGGEGLVAFSERHLLQPLESVNRHTAA